MCISLCTANKQAIEFEFGPESNKEDDKNDDRTNQETMNSDTEKIHTEDTEM